MVGAREECVNWVGWEKWEGSLACMPTPVGWYVTTESQSSPPNHTSKMELSAPQRPVTGSQELLVSCSRDNSGRGLVTEVRGDVMEVWLVTEVRGDVKGEGLVTEVRGDVKGEGLLDEIIL